MPVNPPSWRNDTVLPLPNEVKANAWAVDAACSGNPGPMEYQCIDLQTGAQVFHYGPIHGTNNIGEFLAIVHALALLKPSSSIRSSHVPKTGSAPTPSPYLSLNGKRRNGARFLPISEEKDKTFYVKPM